MSGSPPGSRWRRVLAPLLLGAGLVSVLVWSPWSNETGPPPTRASPGELVVPGDRILGAQRLEGLALSTVALPVQYEIRQVLERLEPLVPERFGGLATRHAFSGLPGAQYAFEVERGPLRVELQGGTVRVSTTVRYGGQLWYRVPFGPQISASCGVADGRTTPDAPRAIVTFASPIGLTPGWELHADVSVEDIEPVSETDRCVVDASALQLDVTETILAQARSALEADAAEIERAIESIDARPWMEEYWATVSRPIRLGEDIWLTLDPEAVRLAIPQDGQTNGRILSANVEVGVRPRILLGERPPSHAGPLPALSLGAEGTSGSVFVEGRAGYDALSTLLARRLEGVRFRAAGRSLRVRDLRISSAGEGRVAVELSVEGGADATLRLEGTPAFDPSQGVLSFPDLEYSVEGDRMARLAAWATRTFLPGYVRERARLRLSDLPGAEVLLAGRVLDLGLGGDASLEGRLGEVRVTQLAATSTALVVRSSVEAEGLLRIEPEARTE